MTLADIDQELPVQDQQETIGAEDKALEDLIGSDGALAKRLAWEHMTEIDFILGQRYFNLLLKHVKEKKKQGTSDIEIRYGELVARLKQEYPNHAHTEAALAINIGRRLYATQMICERCSLPNLTGAVVNGKGVQGRSYRGNWALEKQAIFKRDWDADLELVEQQFGIFRKDVRDRAHGHALAARVEQAVREFYYQDIYCKNKDLLKPRVTQDAKEEIVALLLAGARPEEAVFRVVGVRIGAQ